MINTLNYELKVDKKSVSNQSLSQHFYRHKIQIINQGIYQKRYLSLAVYVRK